MNGIYIDEVDVTLRCDKEGLPSDQEPCVHMRDGRMNSTARDPIPEERLTAE